MENEILQQIREEMERSYRPRQAGENTEISVTGEPSMLESAGVRSALATLQSSYALVGQMPPEPPTWRGRLGANVVKLVQRLLFWYTPQIVHFQYSALRAFEEQAKSLETAGQRLRELQRRQDEAGESLESLKSPIRQLQGELAEQRAQLDRRQEETESRLAEQRAQLELRLAEERRVVAGTASQTEAFVRRLEREVLRLKPELIAQDQRISLLLEEARKRWPEPFDAAQMERICLEELHRLEAFYVALEDEFRGTREEIKERLSIYVTKLVEAGIGGSGMPILDAGCGRGEWLDLLREQHLQATGVDLNRVLLAICRERGLLVEEADAIEYLRSLPEASLGAVTAFHLIEHLPLPRLLDLVDAAVRALKPGGVAVFETPNPNNILVSSRYFYLDPTHRHPIPPQLGRFLAEARGLRRVEILELHPWPEAHHVDTRTGGEVAGRFNECFYGPQDYAIIGWKA